MHSTAESLSLHASSPAQAGCLALLFLLAACENSAPGSSRPAATTANATAAAASTASDTVVGEFLVVLRPSITPFDALTRNTAISAIADVTGIDSVAHIFTSAIEGFHAKGVTADELILLLADPRVARVVPNLRVHALRSARRTETQFDPPWGLDRIDQRGTALDGSYTYVATGQGVDVVILDSGIRSSHREFAAGRIEILRDRIGDGLGGADCDGHGTHVAGTVGGRVYGVAKGVRLRIGRVLDCVGAGTWLTVISAIDDLRRTYLASPIERRRPTILQMSLGSRLAYPPADEAINSLVRAGVVVVVAAGNDARDACTGTPASAELAIKVAASDSVDRRAAFSNYGPCVDVFAPGIGILSAGHVLDTAAVKDSGTSMAAPHVSGAIALYLERYPAATPEQVRTALRSGATERIRDARSGSANLLHSVF